MGSIRRTLIAAAVLTATFVVGAPAAHSATPETYPVPPSGSWPVTGHGWGHGRGLSQWGAQGAALQGVTRDQILGFYYPGTRGVDIGNPLIRVQLQQFAGNAIVFGRYATEPVTVTDLGTGVRGVLGVGGFHAVFVQANTMQVVRRTSTGWAPIALGGRTQLVGPIEFGGPSGAWLYNPNLSGDGRQYWGRIRVIRTGSTTAQAVNFLDTQAYLKGVVPREMPASFATGALQAQTVAARTYARAVSTPSGAWDICDTTACQVYGGRIVAAAGRLTGLESASTNAAVDATRGLALYYGDGPALTQFSASNGGWSVDGGRPYLPARQDPYSGSAPTDPVSSWTDTLPVSRVQAQCPSGGQLRQMVVTGRDGHGDFGGRITSIRVDCTTGSRSLTGEATLRLGMRSSWWTPAGRPFGHLDSVAATASSLRVTGWAIDPDTAAPIYVWLDLDGTGGPVRAGLNRPDLAAAFPAYGAGHGFQRDYPRVVGRHRVCAWAVNVGPGADTPLGCRTVDVPRDPALTLPPGPPIGRLDSASGVPGGIRVSGWAIDPDSLGPIYVWLDVSGQGSPVLASGTRTDVAKVYPSYGASHGFDRVIARPPGTYRVCAHGVNVGPGSDRVLGCRSVTVVS